MADPSTRREIMPQPNQPATLPLNSAAPLSLVAPPSAHPAFHYPQVYVDPVTAAAVYQHQQRQLSQSQPQSHVAHHQSAPVQPPHSQAPHPPAQQRPAQPHAHPIAPQAQPPYFIPDMTTVALQQMQLQTMLQIQAQQQQRQQNHPPSSAPHQRQDPSPLPQPQLPPHTQPTVQQPHVAASQPAPIAAVPSLQPHINPAALATHAQAMITHPTLGLVASSAPASARPSIPVVPESQMASAYRIGRYTPAERRIRLERYREKRAQRNYNRRVKYDCRKMIADKRRRVQGRFVKREEEMALAATESGRPTHHQRARAADRIRNGEGTDGTEDETKLHQPESSGSGSSVRQLEVSIDVRTEAAGEDAASAEQESYCDQSDQVLHQFR